MELDALSGHAGDVSRHRLVIRKSSLSDLLHENILLGKRLIDLNQNHNGSVRVHSAPAATGASVPQRRQNDHFPKSTKPLLFYSQFSITSISRFPNCF